MALAVEHDDADVAHRAPLALGDGSEQVLDRRVEGEQVGDVGSTGQLLHVDGGTRIEHRAPRRDREGGEGIGLALGRQRGALERIDGDVDGRSAGADLLADVEHGRLVLLALADHHDPADGAGLERVAHGIDGGFVGEVLVTPAKPARGGDGTGLRDAGEVKGKRGGEGLGHGDHPSPWRGRIIATVHL